MFTSLLFSLFLKVTVCYFGTIDSLMFPPLLRNEFLAKKNTKYGNSYNCCNLRIISKIIVFLTKKLKKCFIEMTKKWSFYLIFLEEIMNKWVERNRWTSKSKISIEFLKIFICINLHEGLSVEVLEGFCSAMMDWSLWRAKKELWL